MAGVTCKGALSAQHIKANLSGVEKEMKLKMATCHYQPKKFNYKAMCEGMFTSFQKANPTYMHKDMRNMCQLGYPIVQKTDVQDLTDPKGSFQHNRQTTKLAEQELKDDLFKMPQGFKVMDLSNLKAQMQQLQGLGDARKPASTESRSKEPGFVGKTRKDVQKDSEGEVNRAIREKANSELKKGLKNVFGF